MSKRALWKPRWIRSGWQIVVSTSSTGIAPTYAGKISPCLYCCSQVKRCVHEWQTVGRIPPASWSAGSNHQIERGTHSANGWYRFNVSSSSFTWRRLKSVSIFPEKHHEWNCENLPHIIEARSSPTCSSYALKSVGLDNWEEFQVAAKSIASFVYMDDFIKSFQKPE